MTLLKGFINAIESHTHTLTDYAQIKQFGNTSATASAVNTVTAVATSPVASTYTAGSQITAVQYAEMRTVVEAHRVHSHAWDDTTV
jgi:hypothetical protein